jgi:fatty acyl-ACP thioesterase B
VKTAGLLGDGFGSTPEMSKRNLFWVVCQMQAIVERYPCWYDSLNHLFFVLWFCNRKFGL